MKRVTTALVAGAAVASLAYASASALTVNSVGLQVGETSVTCDEDGVKVNWGLETTSDLVHYVRVHDISSECNGSKLFVAVDGTRVPNDGIVIGQSSHTFNFSEALHAEDIEKVKVWIG